MSSPVIGLTTCTTSDTNNARKGPWALARGGCILMIRHHLGPGQSWSRSSKGAGVSVRGKRLDRCSFQGTIKVYHAALAARLVLGGMSLKHENHFHPLFPSSQQSLNPPPEGRARVASYLTRVVV